MIACHNVLSVVQGSDGQRNPSRGQLISASTNTDILCWDRFTASQAVLADMRYQAVSKELCAVVKILEMHEHAVTSNEKAAQMTTSWIRRRTLKKWQRRSARQKQIKKAFNLLITYCHQRSADAQCASRS